VPKASGGYRLTTDFRKLNSLTEAYKFPLEDIKAGLDWLGGKKVITTLDMRDSFSQVVLAEEFCPLTAVRTPLWLYQYTRMPQGLKNSPTTLQRVINETLGDLKGRSAFAYMDDLTVGSVDAESHLQDLREVFIRLRNKGVKLKFTKCCFGRRSIDILGHRVTAKGLQPNVILRMRNNQSK